VAKKKVEEKAEVVTEAAPIEEPTFCLRCGFQSGNKNPTLDEEDKKEYLRRLLANQPYRKMYSMFDGQLTVELENLMGKDAAVLERVVGSLDITNPMEMQSTILKLRGVLYIKTINDEKFPEFQLTDDTDVETLLGEWSARFGERNEDMLIILIRVLLQFTQYQNLLAESAFDRNFWKGAGLG
jgi:hypothetical protein